MFRDIEGGTAQVAVVTNPFYELAEAIRAGARATRPLRNNWYYARRSRAKNSVQVLEYTCAIGAAMWSRGITIARDSSTTLQELFPILNREVNNPITKDRVLLSTAIIDLNDTLRWSREQIADWVDSLT